MTNRIKEIARKAYVEDSKNLNPKWEESDLYHSLMDELDSFFEVFARSIIKECLQSIETTIDMNCNSESEKIGCEYAITDLLQHFGINYE